MIKRIAACFIVMLFMGATISAQELPINPPSISAPVASGSKVDGIELPADQIVAPDEGFVNITAKCKGTVKWLVVSNVKVKYVSNETGNSIIVSVPTTPGTMVTIFAVGLVDGKMTEFARTAIQVGGVSPNPNPNPNPNPPTPVIGKFHLTFVVDMDNASPDLAALLNSAALRKAVADKGGFMRIYDKKSPVVTQKKLDGLVQKAGGGPTIILQAADGTVLNNAELVVPKTDAEVIAIINKYVR